MLIKIKGLSKKMREKVAQHGEWWIAHVSEEHSLVNGGEIMIETTIPVHHGIYPYSGWFVPGKDFEVLETKE